MRVSGVIADTDAPDVGTNFRVVDEYGAIQPSEPVVLSDHGDGTFSFAFTVRFQDRRLGQARDGRQYTILLNAFDDDSSNSASTVVTVPHDRGRRAAFNSNRGRGSDGPFFGDDDDDRDGRRSNSPNGGWGRGVRDLVPIGRSAEGPEAARGPRRGGRHIKRVDKDKYGPTQVELDEERYLKELAEEYGDG